MNITDNYSSISAGAFPLNGALLRQPEQNKRTVESTEPYLVSAMSLVQKQQLLGIVCLWAVISVLFWRWWFEPQHIGQIWRFALNSTVLACTLALPAYYFFFFARIKVPN